MINSYPHNNDLPQSRPYELSPEHVEERLERCDSDIQHGFQMSIMKAIDNCIFYPMMHRQDMLKAEGEINQYLHTEIHNITGILVDVFTTVELDYDMQGERAYRVVLRITYATSVCKRLTYRIEERTLAQMTRDLSSRMVRPRFETLVDPVTFKQTTREMKPIVSAIPENLFLMEE